jgi:hypothetical protein
VKAGVKGVEQVEEVEEERLVADDLLSGSY